MVIVMLRQCDVSMFGTVGISGMGLISGTIGAPALGTASCALSIGGPPVSMARRLCDEAKPGQILISPRVMLAVDKTITVELVGEFNLKGIRRPMAAYNVLAPSISKPN